MADDRLADRPAEFWAGVSKDYYDSNLPILALCTKHDLTAAEFRRARDQLGWRRRHVQKISRSVLINRMFRLLDRGIKQLEDAMTITGHQEVMVLNHLANTLGKLIEIEGSENKRAKPHKTREMQDIREKLVQRIEELKRA